MLSEENPHLFDKKIFRQINLFTNFKLNLQ